MLAFVLPEDGGYDVRVSATDEETATYRLDLELVDAVPASLLEPQTGALDFRNRFDVWPVRSDAGGVLDVSFAPGQYSGLVLLAADGRRLAEASVGDDESEGGFQWPIAPVTTYLVVPTWLGGDPSQYLLTLRVDEARLLVDGAGTGELTELDQFVAFRLDGGLGDANVLLRPQAGLDAFVVVVEPGGAELILADDGGLGQDELFTTRLDQAGAYLVVVGSDSSEGRTGTFDLTVTQNG
jgi:hypothetical protein